ncbi:MAG: spore maturation protein, partial [Candidatus Gastranaerophilales bacterium]|nr:spore maturation protein [Candidatus Gastranaerophilales bacterium]
ILLILTIAIIKKVAIYEVFIEGAKAGARVSISIFPYLAAIIVAISMLSASGAIESVSHFCSGFLDKIHLPADILPLAFVRSLSGSAALGVFSDIIANNDINSYTAKLAAIMLGSSETTFYVLTVYFGAAGIKKYRYALLTGLSADLIGIIMSIIVAGLFFK